MSGSISSLADFADALTVSQMQLHTMADTQQTSSPSMAKLPPIVTQRPSSAQMAKIISDAETRAEKEGSCRKPRYLPYRFDNRFEELFRLFKSLYD